MPISWTDALGDPFGTALLAVAPVAMLVVALRWRRVLPEDRGWLIALAIALLATAAPRALFHAAAAPFDWPAALWLPALDRFASVVGLVTLGLLAVGGRQRLPSAGLLLAALIAAFGWLAWLPAGTSGGAWAWDLGLAALGASVAVLLARGADPAPPWFLEAVGALVAGSLWDAVFASGMASSLGALGARGGALIACTIGLARAAAGERELPRAAPGRDRRDLWDAVTQELRAITVNLGSYQDVFLPQSAPMVAQDFQSHLRTIAVQSHRLTVLMANVGALVEHQHPSTEPATRSADDVRHHVTSSIERAALQFNVKSIHCHQHVPSDLAAPGVDPDVAGRVVDNLLLGAVSRSPFGSSLTFRAETEQDGLALSVAYQDMASLDSGEPEAADEPQAYFGLARFLADTQGGRAWLGPTGHGGQQKMVVWLPERRGT